MYHIVVAELTVLKITLCYNSLVEFVISAIKFHPLLSLCSHSLKVQSSINLNQVDKFSNSFHHHQYLCSSSLKSRGQFYKGEKGVIIWILRFYFFKLFQWTFVEA